MSAIFQFFRQGLHSLLIFRQVFITAFIAVIALGGWAWAEVDFTHQIVPILKAKCAKCHLAENKKGGFSMNTRASFLEGSENGKVVTPGESAGSHVIKLVTTDDADLLMPPKGDRLSPVEVALLKQWIDEKMPWDTGFSFGNQSYEPPLKHRNVKIPVIKHPEVVNDIDRIVASYLSAKQKDFTPRIDDAAFLRRVSLDLIGLLPRKEELDSFLKNPSPDKRERVIARLLANDADYTAHWLTFWNDLLRNAYQGTGFIDGGRKQITDWIIPALRKNLPYDEMVRQLVAQPTAESEGFINGIQWRGDVNASQTREVQFSQNIGQVFLGINMKCASCHDSFVDRWKLDEAYHLAAIVATAPLEIHRCDKATGKFARAAWIFPELGQIDAKADKAVRLRQLAELLVHPDNGRTTRTMANRIWHRLMGRGIVHPVDAMDTEPWSEDLLDHLANYLVEQKYDLRKLMAYIASSRTYQSRSVVIADEADLDDNYAFIGPVARRMTAEQFIDAIEQLGNLTVTSPRAILAHLSPEVLASAQDQIHWLELFDFKASPPAAKTAGYLIRSRFQVSAENLKAGRILAQVNTGLADEVSINGAKVEGLDHGKLIDVKSRLKEGENEISIEFPAKRRPHYVWNAFIFAETAGLHSQPPPTVLLNTANAGQWEWKSSADEAAKWSPPALLNIANHPNAKVINQIKPSLAETRSLFLNLLHPGCNRARMALRDIDLLQRALGRPNREQVVSMRENRLTMLQAMDLANGDDFARLIANAAAKFEIRISNFPEGLVRQLFAEALCREPTPLELAVSREILGREINSDSMQDFLWNLVMLPEFQMVQ